MAQNNEIRALYDVVHRVKLILKTPEYSDCLREWVVAMSWTTGIESTSKSSFFNSDDSRCCFVWSVVVTICPDIADIKSAAIRIQKVYTDGHYDGPHRGVLSTCGVQNRENEVNMSSIPVVGGCHALVVS